ncbi:MAG: class IIb bacteriocin, lactobin A/cerein 7B family [Streptococcaceae bacterium]|jgi:bacteriocin-like protein|nr:class IIb bacteriocin, lactobin A/cerein 7B family [Streptococcaceae bacterium]
MTNEKMMALDFAELTNEELMEIKGGRALTFWDGVRDGMSEGADFVMSFF